MIHTDEHRPMAIGQRTTNSMNFRIAYFSDLEFPSNAVATKQIAKTADALQNAGWSVDLFFPIPWRRIRINKAERLGTIRRYYGLSERLGLNELPTPLPMIQRLHRPIFSRFAIRRIAQLSYDLVYVRNVFHLQLALTQGLQVIFETYRYTADEKNNRRIAILAKRYNNFLGVITHSELTRRHLQTLGVPAEKIITIYNGYDETEVPPNISKTEARQRLKIDPDQKIICYTGNISREKHVESILEMAQFLPEIHFYIIGGNHAADIRRLKSFAQSLGINNFTLLPWMAPTELGVYLFAADALIIPPTAKPLLEGGQTVLPIKTFIYLAVGIPIIAPLMDDTSEILNHAVNAILLPPDRPRVNAWTIRELFLDGDLMEKVSANALATAKILTWTHRAEKIITFIRERMTV